MTAIRDFIQSEPLFESHDHQPGFSRHDWSGITFREFDSYVRADIGIAMGTGLTEERISDNDEFFRHWPFFRTTGYGRPIEIAIRQLCDMELSRETADDVTQSLRDFTAKRSVGEVYDECFRLANITGSVNDILPATDFLSTKKMDGKEYPDIFRFAPRLDMLLVVSSTATIHELEKILGCSITSLQDLGQAMDRIVADAVALGRVAALKIGVAYNRCLDFDEVPETTAAEIFSALMAGRVTELKPLHDYLFHRYLQCAMDHGLPVQIHTGYLAGLNTDIRQGDPAPLLPVFAKYPEIRFDLFHASWPYSEFIGAVGKHFPNVWLDMCWAWAMNPVQMERVLDEWLAAVPCNKILGYGSDTTTPFAVIGYAQQARDGIASVLERKIARGEYDEETAQFVARRVMHENARALFT